MKKISLTIILFALLLNVLAQDKPTVKKLPVRITMIEGDINKKTGKRGEELKEEYSLTYNNSNQLINSSYDYYRSNLKNTISSNYTYNKQGNLLNEVYIREEGEKWYSTFEYKQYEGINFVIVKKSYGEGESMRDERAYPFDPVTGLFASDKGLGDNYHEYEFDGKNNLVRIFYDASTMAYKTTETYEYGTAYSPYVCINKLPVWYSENLPTPRILITGDNTPISYTIVSEHDYEEERNSTEKTTYTITVDKDNYPIKIVENRDPDLSENYLYFNEYTFIYNTID